MKQRGAGVGKRLRRDSDIIFVAVERREELDRMVGMIVSLAPDGALWVIRPKGSNAISEREVMDTGRAAGFVDVKVARLSDTHTAEKFVIKKKFARHSAIEGREPGEKITPPMSVMSYKLMDFDPVVAVQLPMSERVLDRLADIMFASDEILDMLGTQSFMADDTKREVEGSVRRVYNQVNDLMKKLTD